jgi:PmbA protein
MKNIDEIIARTLTILRSKPIDGYEIYLDQSSHFDVESKEGGIDTFEVSHSLGMAIRILNRQRVGFSYTTSPGVFLQDQANDFLTGLEQVIDDAIDSARRTTPDPYYDFAPPLKEALPSLPIFDETLETTSEKVKIDKAKDLEEAARSVDPEKIRKVRKASYHEAIAHRTLINSNGLQFSYPSTFCSVGVTAVAEEAEEAEVGWDFDASHFQSDLDVKSVGREAGRKALESLGGRKISSGIYPVLIHHDVASEFLSLLAHSFKSDQIQKGKSPLKGKKGERCFSPLITVEDNGLHPKGIFSAPIDGEGTRSQQTPLAVEGELSGYLYDRYWANRESASSGSIARSTGNSRRSGIKSPPGIGTSNLLIEPGTLSFSALLSDLHQGVLLEEVMGLHTVDPISGDFSLGCSGKWVDKGKPVHAVKSVAVAGNLFQLFRDVAGIGEDFRFIGGIGSPSLLVRSLKISGI